VGQDSWTPLSRVAFALAWQKWKFATAYLFFPAIRPFFRDFHLPPTDFPRPQPHWLYKRSMNRERNSSGKLSRNVASSCLSLPLVLRPVSLYRSVGIPQDPPQCSELCKRHTALCELTMFLARLLLLPLLPRSCTRC